MFNKIKEFFVGKPASEVVAPGGAPYKMPEPAVTPPIPLVVANNVPVGIEAVIAAPVTEVVVETVVAIDPVAVALDLEPAALATPTKKPRKPRAPKVEPIAAVKEKAPAKTRAPKLTVVKAEKTPRSKKA